MTNDDSTAFVQLVTRVPRPLKRRLKLHCLVAETTMMDFVLKAIRDGLDLNGTPDTTQRRRPRGVTR